MKQIGPFIKLAVSQDCSSEACINVRFGLWSISLPVKKKRSYLNSAFMCFWYFSSGYCFQCNKGYYSILCIDIPVYRMAKKLKTTLSLLLCLVLLQLCAIITELASLYIFDHSTSGCFSLSCIECRTVIVSSNCLKYCQTHLCTHSLIGKHISCYTKRISKWCYNTLAHHEAKNQFRSV